MDSIYLTTNLEIGMHQVRSDFGMAQAYISHTCWTHIRVIHQQDVFYGSTPTSGFDPQTTYHHLTPHTSQQKNLWIVAFSFYPVIRQVINVVIVFSYKDRSISTFYSYQVIQRYLDLYLNDSLCQVDSYSRCEWNSYPCHSFSVSPPPSYCYTA